MSVPLLNKSLFRRIKSSVDNESSENEEEEVGSSKEAALVAEVTIVGKPLADVAAVEVAPVVALVDAT